MPKTVPLGQSFKYLRDQAAKAVPVGGVQGVPVNVSLPTLEKGIAGTDQIDGNWDSTTLRVGDTVVLTDGSWVPTPTSFSKTHLRDGAPIGITTTSRVLSTDDVGKMVSGRVVAIKNGPSLPATSLAVGPVLSATAVAITGTPQTTAVQNKPYSGFTAVGSGGNGNPLVYSLIGTWPSGITVGSSTGVVSGTPTQSGDFTGLSIRVSDGTNFKDLDPFTLRVAILALTDNFAYADQAAAAAAGWSFTDTSATFAAGKMRLTNSAAGGNARKSFPVISGKSYTITATADQLAGGNFTNIRVRNAASTTIGTTGSGGSGNKSLPFTAAATQNYIVELRHDAAGGIVDWSALDIIEVLS